MDPADVAEAPVAISIRGVEDFLLQLLLDYFLSGFHVITVLRVKSLSDGIHFLFRCGIAVVVAVLLLFLLGKLLFGVGGSVSFDQLLLIIDGSYPVLPI